MRGHEYSVYADVSLKSKKGVYAALAVLAASLVWGIQSLGTTVARDLFKEESAFAKALLLLGSIATLGVFGLLVLAFNRWAWRQKWMAPFFAFTQATQPVALHGTYEGRVVRRVFGEGGAVKELTEWPLVATITQTWEHIGVFFRFHDPPIARLAESESDMAALIIKSPDEAILRYTYRHERKPEGAPLRHDGTSTMSFKRSGGLWSATGTFYSEEHSSGEIYLQQKS